MQCGDAGAGEAAPARIGDVRPGAVSEFSGYPLGTA